MNETRNVLLIVEGPCGEAKILKKLNHIFDVRNNYDIVVFGTSIYELYDDIVLDDTLDLILLLRSKTHDLAERQMLERPFSSTFLIFDFDPHYQKHEKGKLDRMLMYFSDSRENGKLLISYPMIESFRHLKTMPDHQFRHRTVDGTRLSAYKAMVGIESEYVETNKYTYPIAMNMIGHHLAKVQYLVSGEYRIPSYDEYIDLHHQTERDLLGFEEMLYEEKRLVHVVCTAAFFIIDLRPRSFFDRCQTVVIL